MNELMHRVCLGTTLLFLVFIPRAQCAAQQQNTPGYKAPGTPEVGGVEHMVLIYHGRESRPERTKENLMPYVAYVDEQGLPQDWLFDSFLFIEFLAPSGADLHFYSEERGRPLPTVEDWRWLADGWFRPTTGLIGLEQAVDEVAETLGPADRRANVVITIPMPFRADTSFGPLPGQEQTLDFTETSDRFEAVKWYVQRVLRRWNEHDYEHLQLVGFYWLNEHGDEKDHELIRRVSTYIHSMDYKFFRIPFWYVPEAWKEIGFDAIMPHPLYYRPTEAAHLVHLLAAAQKASRYNMGVELEFDKHALEEEKYTRRMIAGLDAGAHYGWMNGAVMAYYTGNDSINRFAETPGTGRKLYQKLYEYVKGTYVPSGANDFSNVPLENNDNLALLSRGAKIHGGVRWNNRPDIVPECLIDGIFYYNWKTRYGFLQWPDSFVIQLPEMAIVSRTQMLLYEYHDQTFNYKIHTSMDGKQWDLAVDKSEGEWRSWQVDEFTPRPARYVRLTGLHNSFNKWFRVVEFEVYGDHR